MGTLKDGSEAAVKRSRAQNRRAVPGVVPQGAPGYVLVGKVKGAVGRVGEHPEADSAGAYAAADDIRWRRV